MNSLAPKTYQDALDRVQSRLQKPRARLARKLLSKQSDARSPNNGLSGHSSPKRGVLRPVLKAIKVGKKRPRNLTDGQLKKRVWREFSIFIRTTGAGPSGLQQCFTCSHVAHWKTLEAGHLVPGRTNAILFNELAVKPQCRRCNGHFRGNTIVYYPKLVALLGQPAVDDIVAQRDVTHKWQPSELLRLLEKYKGLNAQNPLVTENKSWAQ